MATLHELDQFLRQFSCCSVLLEIAKANNLLFQKNVGFYDVPVIISRRRGTTKITPWGLAFLAHRVILVSNDGRSKVFQHEDLCYSTWLYSELDDAFLEDNDTFEFLGRLSQEQFIWQDYPVYRFARNYILLVELPKKIRAENLNKEFQIDLENHFIEHFGISIQDFLVIAYTIFGRALINPCLQESELIKHKVPVLSEILVREKVDKFLSLTSGNYSQIRSLSNQVNRLTLTGYEKYEFNPLFKFPIIRGDSRYRYYSQDFQLIVPSLGLLIRKLTDGIYWELKDLFNRDNSREFLKSFGLLFEAYVGELLKRYFGQGSVERLEKIQEKRNSKIADWLVDAEDVLMIFECKSSLLPFKVRQTYNKKLFDNWAKDVFFKGALQLQNSQNLLSSIEKYREIEVYKFIVLNEDLYLAEETLFKNSIMSRLREASGQSVEFYIISIRELELLEKAIAKFGIKRIIDEKKKIDAEHPPQGGHNFIAACKRIGEINLSNQWLKETYDRYFQDSFLLSRLQE